MSAPSLRVGRRRLHLPAPLRLLRQDIPLSSHSCSCGRHWSRCGIPSAPEPYVTQKSILRSARFHAYRFARFTYIGRKPTSRSRVSGGPSLFLSSRAVRTVREDVTYPGMRRCRSYAVPLSPTGSGTPGTALRGAGWRQGEVYFLWPCEP